MKRGRNDARRGLGAALRPDGSKEDEPIVGRFDRCLDLSLLVFKASELVQSSLAKVPPDYIRVARVALGDFAGNGYGGAEMFAEHPEEIDFVFDDAVNSLDPNDQAVRADLESHRAAKHAELAADAIAIAASLRRAGLPEATETYNTAFADWTAAMYDLAASKPTSAHGCRLMAEFIHERMIAPGDLDRELVARASRSLANALAAGDGSAPSDSLLS